MKELNKEISIIIILYKEEFELLKKCLKNIFGFKIIIIDNDGNSELKRKIEKEFNIYKYVLNKENVGLSKAANKAIELVDTPFVLNLQADCEITNPDIDKLHQALKKYDNSFLVSPTFYSDNKLTFNSTPLPEKQIDQKVLKIEGDVCVDTVLASVIFFKKEEFIKLGGFDEFFFLYFLDYDLCRRILNKKKSIIQLHDVRVKHMHGNLKLKNKIRKTFIRNFHFTRDELYYYYKINSHLKILNKLEKKLLIYKFKIIFNFLILRFNKSVYYYAKILAFYKFLSLIKK